MKVNNQQENKYCQILSLMIILNKHILKNGGDEICKNLLQ